MDLNFLIGRLILIEEETPKPPDIVGLVKRINTEKHAKGKRISAEHLATVCQTSGIKHT